MQPLTMIVRPLMIVALLIGAAWFAGVESSAALASPCSVASVTQGPTVNYNLGNAATTSPGTGAQDDRCESGGLAGSGDNR